MNPKESEQNEEWKPSEVGIETIYTERGPASEFAPRFARFMGEAMQGERDWDLAQMTANFSAPVERIRLNRRQRLRHWLREHRPHVHFGECKVEDEYD